MQILVTFLSSHIAHLFWSTYCSWLSPTACSHTTANRSKAAQYQGASRDHEQTALLRGTLSQQHAARTALLMRASQR